MTPEQFLDQIKKRGADPVYLFLGQEGYNRERCRKALVAAVLGEDIEGVTRHELDQVSLSEALDDARSLSLFVSKRIVWLGSAEAALPRGRVVDSDEGESSDAGLSSLDGYLKQPTPDTVVVIDAARFDFEGEDKEKLARVQKYYGAVKSVVEFRAFSPESARALAQSLANQVELTLGAAELALLIDATAGDACRLAVEIEKLKLYVGSRKVTADDILQLVPDAQAANIFALVSALGRGDRARAMELLDVLSREGEYMPLALTFLATQFRMALVARESRAGNAAQIQALFNKLGARIWPDRARQIEQTVGAFPKAKLEKAIVRTYDADKGLRDARPDDRTVMEELILAICSAN